MNTIELICKQCLSKFTLPLKEYNRQVKNGRDPLKFFCSGTCSTTYNNNHLSIEDQEKRKNRLLSYNKRNKHAKKYDENFYHYIRQSRNKKFTRKREKFQYTDIDEIFLKELWKQQQGKCAISGIDIYLRKYNQTKSLYIASLDRKDSTIGYIKDNVQFVAMGINYAKNGFSDSEMKDFIETIRKG